MANIRNLPTWWAGEATISPAAAEAQTIDEVTGALKMNARFNVPDAATADLDFTNDTGRTIRIVDCWFVKTGGAGAAGNTVQLKNAANAITDAINTNVAINLLVRAAQIASAQHTLAAGGTLRITATKAGGSAAGILYVDYVFL